MIKFNEKIFISFHPNTNVFTVSRDGEEPFVLKGGNATNTIASLLDRFAWWKVEIVETMERDDFSWLGHVPLEARYDFQEDTVVRVLLVKEERVKSFFDKQKLPTKLLKALPKEVKKELFITKKQLQFIQFLIEGLDEFLIDDGELKSLTKREASALIKYLQTLEPSPTP
jgi:hypothetical protein